MYCNINKSKNETSMPLDNNVHLVLNLLSNMGERTYKKEVIYITNKRINWT
jgi:hypothetical protein